MIFVDRSTVVAPAILSKPFDDGTTETERAIEHYTVNWDGKTAFNFKRYKHDIVKEALERLFHGKCAYCESNFRHVSPEDIEHWRPKGEVRLENGVEQKPGYYWLAATWTNLLPSCIDCNRRRRQEDVTDPTNLQSGKANLFPVADESNRWRKHDQANIEVPLLLDPCADEPSDFLEIEDGVVKEKPTAGTLENDRARSSIDVFGLNRSGLVKRRREERLRLAGILADIRLLLRTVGGLPAGDIRDDNVNSGREKIMSVARERANTSEYLLMKRPLIDEFMMELGPQLQDAGFLSP